MNNTTPRINGTALEKIKWLEENSDESMERDCSIKIPVRTYWYGWYNLTAYLVLSPDGDWWIEQSGK